MLIYDEDEQTYRNQPRLVTFSKLKLFRQSRKHYRRAMLGLCPGFEETPAMRRGTAGHAMFLEGQRAFEKRFVVINDKVKRGTKAWLENEADGRLGIKASEYHSLNEMANALEENDFATSLIQTSKREVVARHEDALGLPFGVQGRLDILHPLYGVCDLKITDTFDQRHRLIADRDYVGQVAFYSWLESDGLLTPARSCHVVWLEGVEPYRCQVVTIALQEIQMAHKLNMGALAQLAECMAEDMWVDGQDVVAWDVPPRYYDKIEITGIAEQK